jgi:hypothetical protein
MLSLPALITGTRIVAAKPAGPAELLITPAGGGPVLAWSRQVNVFSRLRAIGVESHVVGWYHPYCRVLGKDLASCEWEPSFETALGRVRDPSFLGSLADQFLTLSPVNRKRLAIQSYWRTLQRSLQVLADGRTGLIFFHFPIPHPPGIFDRGRSELGLTVLSSEEGYLGNLALVDRTLGRLRMAMEASGTWDSSTVLVTSDHHWRESHSIGGRRDDRVPFLLKLAGQRQGQEVQAPFDTICTGDLFLALLQGQIGGPDAAAAWLSARGAETTAIRGHSTD